MTLTERLKQVLRTGYLLDRAETKHFYDDKNLLKTEDGDDT